ncbi:MAG TPA: glycosyltransferase family 4 protein [Sphingobacterium sp.]|nr:glycosyltransferase family 4 protein [Sphingobacterium sp.]
MKRKLKLAYIIPGLFYPSGMERVLTAKVNYFVKKFDYEIHIFVTDGKGSEPYYPLDEKIKLHHLDINFDGIFSLPLLKRTLSYRKKQRLFKARLGEQLCLIKPDITVSLLRRDINFINDLKDGSLKVGELHFNRLVYRQFTDKRFPGFMQRGISKLWQGQLIKNLRKLSAFVVLTNEDAGYWHELNNISVISNPLSFYPDKSPLLNNKQVIAVGRMTYQKGFDLLISAWEMVAKKHPEWILKIYGGGDKAMYLSMVKELGLSGSCFLENGTASIAEKYDESSIFVLSSRYEGFPLVLGETMAYGVPPVSFMCPCGPRDIIVDGQNGLLVENGNIKQLADGICLLIEDDARRKEMGKNARNDVRKFDLENIAKQWQQLFESIRPVE